MCRLGETKCLTSGCGGAWCSGKVALRAVAMVRCMDEHGLVRRKCSDDAGVDCYCVLVHSCPDMKLDGGSSCDGHGVLMQNFFLRVRGFVFGRAWSAVVPVLGLFKLVWDFRRVWGGVDRFAGW